MSNNIKCTFSNRILTWFEKYGRKNLPWQQNRTPYRVWVSEIMLQQTQVVTVIPYYEHFMESFPNVFKLAKATQDEVLNHWAGLGYYARGRNLHKCAQTVVKQYKGIFPSTVDILVSLSGIGRSTAGAIISLSSGKRGVILDGNVKRVLSRYYGVYGWTGKTSVANTLWKYAENHTPNNRCDDFNQGLMDLGATLCTPTNPECKCCPLSRGCFALNRGRLAELPTKKPKKVLPVNTTQWVIIRNLQQHIYLEQRPQQGVWGGLWSFPEIAATANSLDYCESYYGSVDTHVSLSPFRHTFTHYHLDIQVTFLQLKNLKQKNSNKIHRWITSKELLTIGTAAPIKRLLKTLCSDL